MHDWSYQVAYDLLNRCDLPGWGDHVTAELAAALRAAYYRGQRDETERIKGESIMAIEGKYGVITAEKKQFHPGEPVFLLRATDRLAPRAIEDYAEMCEQCGCSFDHVAAVRAHAGRLREWQQKNPQLVKKIPD